MHEKAKIKKSFSVKKPMLATLAKDIFSDKKWLFERKFDGIRLLVLKKNQKVFLYSRNKNILNQSFPEILEAFKKMKQDNFVIDGELVALDKGLSSFSKLQQRIHVKSLQKSQDTKVNITFFVFDILQYKGFDLKKVPLIERKKILKTALEFNKKIRYTSHRLQNGKGYLDYAAQKGWEGIIGKKIDSIYCSKRSTSWLKFKCINRQEMVICGFTKPSGSRIGFGALLLGYYHKGALKYAGKVGTGFSDATLQSLSVKLKAITRAKASFKDQIIQDKDVIWVSPKLVCQVEFTEWTKDGKLRHPSFLGLRDDKSPKSISKKP